jgi:ribosomal protein L11 methyltransferase
MFYRLTPELVLRSAWRPYRARPGERVLAIRSKAVFPPGHATTGLCLKLLPEALAARPAARLLDLGCGSGILALAGAALGVPFCAGVDLAWPAVRLSRENARENGLAAQVRVAQGSTECLRGPFDLLLANLPWEVQLARAAELCRLAAPEGALILSGFKDTQEQALQERYRTAGWFLNRRLARDEFVPELPPEKSFTWVAWLLRRGAP